VIRPALLVALALGFLTAFVAGMLGMVVVESDQTESRVAVEAQRTEPVVEAFYNGINAWIADEDPGLEQVLAPGFVDHTASNSPDRNAEEFFGYLSDVRIVAPGSRLEILAIEGSGAVVSVDLERAGMQIPSIDGWEIDLPAQQLFREILRIEHGLVAERWSLDDVWPSGLASAQRTISIGYDEYEQPAIQRFELDPEGAFRLVARGTVMLWVESGELEIDLNGTDQTGAVKFSTDPLAPGDVRFVQPDGDLNVRALGGERVGLWTVSMHTILENADTMGLSSAGLPTGIRQDASVGLRIQFPFDAVRLSVLIVTLPVGSTLLTNAASMHAVAVVSGELHAQPETGAIFYCYGESRSRLLSDAATALSSEGFANQSGSAASYQVVGSEPTTLVLLSISAETPARSHLVLP